MQHEMRLRLQRRVRLRRERVIERVGMPQDACSRESITGQMLDRWQKPNELSKNASVSRSSLVSSPGALTCCGSYANCVLRILTDRILSRHPVTFVAIADIQGLDQKYSPHGTKQTCYCDATKPEGACMCASNAHGRENNA